MLLSIGIFLPSIGGILFPSQAYAEESRVAHAREVFAEAIRLEETRSFDEALKKFREVAEVKVTPQVLFHIGICQEHLLQWPDALLSYSKASTLAAQSPETITDEVKGTIDVALQSLEKRTPTLLFKRGKGAKNATISVDNRKVTNPGEPLRLMPGKYTVRARAKGRDNFRREVILKEGQTSQVEVTLDLLDDGSEAEADPKEVQESTSVVESRSVAPYVVLGLGGASLAASGIFFLLRNSAEDELNRTCIGTTCPSSAQSTGDRAVMMNTLTNITVGVGVAGASVGLIWLLASGGKSSEKSARIQVTPTISQRVVGAGLSGSF